MNWLKKLLNQNKIEVSSPVIDEPSINAIKVKPVSEPDKPRRRSNQTGNNKSAPSWSYPTGTIGPSSHPLIGPSRPERSHGVSGTAGTSGVSGASGQSGTSGHAGTSNFTRYKQLIEEDGVFDDYVTDGIFDISAFDTFDVDL